MTEPSAGRGSEVAGRLLLCVTPPGPVPGPHLAGPAAGAVRAVPVPGLTLWVEATDSLPPPSAEALRGHQRVVEAAHAAGTVVPVRFGQWFPDEEALVRAAGERREAFLDAVERVRGSAEHGVRLADPAEPVPGAGDRPPPGGSGRRWLEALRDRERTRRRLAERGEALAEEMERALEGLVRERRVETLPRGGGLVSVAWLVEEARGAAYEEAVDRFASAHPELAVVRTGPWPPWSFVA